MGRVAINPERNMIRNPNEQQCISKLGVAASCVPRFDFHFPAAEMGLLDDCVHSAWRLEFLKAFFQQFEITSVAASSTRDTIVQ